MRCRVYSSHQHLLSPHRPRSYREPLQSPRQTHIREGQIHEGHICVIAVKATLYRCGDLRPSEHSVEAVDVVQEAALPHERAVPKPGEPGDSREGEEEEHAEHDFSVLTEHSLLEQKQLSLRLWVSGMSVRVTGK